MKFTVNHKCPCGSTLKYKRCCQPLHKGKLPQNALELMKARYVAYKLHLSKFIIQTTHIDNKDYLEDFILWEKQILEFSNNYNFKRLEILKFIDGFEEAFVTFKVQLFLDKEDNSFTEESKFVKVDDIWLYHSGQFSKEKDIN